MSGAPPAAPGEGSPAPGPRFAADLLARRGAWIDALIVLAVITLAFISSFFFYDLQRYRERHGLVPTEAEVPVGDPSLSPTSSPEGV